MDSQVVPDNDAAGARSDPDRLRENEADGDSPSVDDSADDDDSDSESDAPAEDGIADEELRAVIEAEVTRKMGEQRRRNMEHYEKSARSIVTQLSAEAASRTVDTRLAEKRHAKRWVTRIKTVGIILLVLSAVYGQLTKTAQLSHENLVKTLVNIATSPDTDMYGVLERILHTIRDKSAPADAPQFGQEDVRKVTGHDPL